MTGKSESGNEFRTMLVYRESGDARPADNHWRPRAMISPARKTKKPRTMPGLLACWR